MRTFTDGDGREWVATALEEDSPRHHTRWYLVFRPADDGEHVYPMAEVRWQTAETADRTLRTMSVFELRRRLSTTLGRAASTAP